MTRWSFAGFPGRAWSAKQTIKSSPVASCTKTTLRRNSMSDVKDRTSVYVTGGPVQAGKGIYIPRKTDDELLRLCQSRDFAYVLTPRQMGKSSLMERTVSRLRREGVRTVKID